MTVDTIYGVPAGAVERIGTKLPYHEDTAERITLGILTLFHKLRDLQTLEPDPVNGRLFNQLFDLVTMSKTTTRQEEKIMSDPRILSLIPSLWQIWGDAEYLLELTFARKVISGAATSPAQCRQVWESFPYMDQYRQLARMETNTLDTALGERGLPPVRKIAFLGAGPAPFSALCFRERLGPDVEVVNIDRSVEAIEHGRAVARGLGDETMGFVLAEVSTGTLTPPSSDDDEAGTKASSSREEQGLAMPSLKDCDLVHFAALIGETEKDKRDLLVAVARSMRPGALIMLRSTDSLRQVLYPKMDVDCWEVLSVVTPVLATRYFGGATSLTTIVVSVDGKVE